MIVESKILNFARMRKNVIFIITLFLLSACETDFDVVANWEDNTIVYGLLEANQDTHYVKIYKAFLGAENALVMAGEPDSIYYNPSDIEVHVNEYLLSGSLNNTYTLRDTTLGQLVSISNAATVLNRAYYFVSPLNQSINGQGELVKRNYIYELVISKPDTVKARMQLVEDEIIDQSDNPLNFMVSNYNPSADMPNPYRSSIFNWDDLKNGVAYRLDMRFVYDEYENTPGGNFLRKDSIEWRIFEGFEEYECTFDGETFFTRLGSLIEENPNLKRYAVDLKIIFTVGGVELYDYYEYSQPSFSVLLEKPEYEGNVEGGYGVFSSRIQQEISRGINQVTEERLVIDPYTADLNFRFN